MCNRGPTVRDMLVGEAIIKWLYNNGHVMAANALELNNEWMDALGSQNFDIVPQPQDTNVELPPDTDQEEQKDACIYRSMSNAIRDELDAEIMHELIERANAQTDTEEEPDTDPPSELAALTDPDEFETDVDLDATYAPTMVPPSRRTR